MSTFSAGHILNSVMRSKGSRDALNLKGDFLKLIDFIVDQIEKALDLIAPQPEQSKILIPIPVEQKTRKKIR